MSVMKFLDRSLVNTTTMIIVGSNTDLSQYIFDRDTETQYSSLGFADDLTSTIISIVLNSGSSVDRIFIQNHNLRQFRIFYNSTTASVFSPDALVSSNSATAHYFSFATTTVNSIQIQMDKTIVANQEKAVGEIYIGALKLDFERNPAADSFKPLIYRKQVEHEMPNGGISQYNVGDKNRYSLKFKFLTETFKDDLLDVYNESEAFYYLPFPTTTSWDGKAQEVVWSGGFDFTYSSNPKDAGFSGSINLKETA